MNEIIKKVIKYKETMDDIYFESIIDQFIPYINCYLKKVAIFYQEDLFQEKSLKIIMK